MARPRDDDVRLAAVLAAIECIASNGISGLSFREVARIAGVSTGTLTYHFGSKRTLLLEAAHFGYWQLPESFEQRPAIQSMRYVLRRYTLSTPKRRAWWRFWLAISASSQTDDELRELLGREYGSIVTRWSRALDRGQGEGVFRADIDPGSEATRLAATAHGVAVAQLVGATGVDAAARQLRGELDLLCTPLGLAFPG